MLGAYLRLHACGMHAYGRGMGRETISFCVMETEKTDVLAVRHSNSDR